MKIEGQTPTLTSSSVAPADLLLTARVLLGDDPEQARELLFEVVELDEGGPLARDAMALLAQLDRSESPGEPARDPEAEALRDRWLELNGPEDGRLPSLLAELIDSPASLRALQVEVEEDVGRWIRETATSLEAAVAQGDEVVEPPVGSVTRLVESVTKVARLEMVLRPDIATFRQARFGLLLHRLTPEIELAVGHWKIEKARELHERLVSPSGMMESGHVALQETIDNAEQLLIEVEHRLDCLREERVDSWARLRSILAAVGDAAPLRDEKAIPTAWRDRLHAAIEEGRRQGREFLEDTARQLEVLEEIRQFWGQLRRLEAMMSAAALVVDPAWLEAATQRWIGRWQERAQGCVSVEELDRVMAELEADLALAPPPVAASGRDSLAELKKLARGWRAVQRGERCEKTASRFSPSALNEVMEEHDQRLRRLDEGFRLLDASAQGFRRATEIADEVLQRFPGHGEASRLRHAARGRKLRQNLDSALASWDVDRFLSLATDSTAPPEYRRLLDHRDDLERLGELARAPAFASSEEASRWWQELAKAIDSWPSQGPTFLRSSQAILLRRRNDQWRALLDEQLAHSPGVQHWRDLLRQLEGVAGDSQFDPSGELVRYQQEFRLRARLATIEQQIDDGRWQEAATELEDLAGDDDRKQRLVVRLAVEQSLGSKRWSALAEALHRWWGAVVEIYGERALELLDQGLSGAWESGECEALEVLRKVAQRARRTTAEEDARRPVIDDWLTWLQLEGESRNGVRISEVGKLVGYLDHLEEPDRLRRAASLMATWLDRGNDLSLAWLYRAFPTMRGRLFPDLVDPSAAVLQRCDELTEEIESRLALSDEPAVDELADLIDRLKALEAELAELDHLLDALPRQSERVAPPSSFAAAGTRLRSLIEVLSALDRLVESDLRAEQGALDSCRFIAAQQLRDVPLQQRLLDRIDRLAPLTRLRSEESKLRRTAERCNGDDLDRPDLFADLARCIRRIDGELQKAAMGEAPVAQAILEQYRVEITALAGDLNSPAQVRDLDSLADHFERLGDDVERIRRALTELDHGEPFVGSAGRFDPDSHRGYLALMPSEPPASRRALRLFDRFSRIGERRAVLERCAQEEGRLPRWIDNYLRQGVA